MAKNTKQTLRSVFNNNENNGALRRSEMDSKLKEVITTE